MIQNYRNSDPPTSVLAGHAVEARGLSTQQREMCFDVVVQIPGLTAREVEVLLGIKAHKRLPELRHDGAVRNGAPRPCTISGKLAMTWQPSDHKNPNAGDQT